MRDQTGAPPWRVYERIVAATEAEQSGMEFTVTQHAKIRGRITGIQREIDVLIDARWGDNEIRSRIIVDAKCYRRKLHVKDVKSFEGMMRDCRAQRGILVCANGFSRAAERRAQDAITIKLLPLDKIDEFLWAQFDRCRGKCRRLKNGKEGLVLWDGQLALASEGLWSIVWLGKCDRCYNFHIWCWDCGDKFALADEDERTCNCGKRWVTAIEQEVSNDGVLKAFHLLLLMDGRMLPLDRRRLR